MNTLLSSSGHIAKCVAITGLAVLMLWFGALARQPLNGGPVRIVRLELASTVDAANEFMRAWKSQRPTWQQDLQRAQAWDTWFICAYAPLFTLLCWLAAAHLSRSYPNLGAMGYALAGAQLLAGALDFVENAAMQRTIDAGYATAPWPAIGATASAVKWVLILTFVLYSIAAALHWIVAAARQSFASP